MMNLNDCVKELRKAAETRSPIAPFSSATPEFSLAEGYEVQARGLEAALGEGRRLCGYKMGLTSAAKQRDVNVFEPIRGYLLSEMEVEKGGKVNASIRIHPRVEPEIAIVLKSPLEGDHVSLREVERALELVLPALEILDSRYQAFSFKLPDVVADNTSAAGFMLGRNNLLSRLREISLLGVTVKKNGEILETGAPAAVLGDPLRSVSALARMLFREGKRIEPGMVILTGGITASVPFKTGDCLEIVWPDEILSFQVD